MKTGLGNWSRKFFPRLHREGLNSNEKEKKKIKKKGKRRKKEEKRAKIYIVIKFECETAWRGMFIRKKKKGERKKGGRFCRETRTKRRKYRFPSRFVWKLCFLSSRGKHAQVCLSSLEKRAFTILGAIAERRSDDTLVSNEIVENFILEETDPPNRIQRVARWFFFSMAKGFLLAKFPLSSFGWISFVRSSKIFPTFCPKDNWLDNR